MRRNTERGGLALVRRWATSRLRRTEGRMKNPLLHGWEPPPSNPEVLPQLWRIEDSALVLLVLLSKPPHHTKQRAEPRIERRRVERCTYQVEPSDEMFPADIAHDKITLGLRTDFLSCFVTCETNVGVIAPYLSFSNPLATPTTA